MHDLAVLKAGQKVSYYVRLTWKMEDQKSIWCNKTASTQAIAIQFIDGSAARELKSWTVLRLSMNMASCPFGGSNVTP